MEDAKLIDDMDRAFSVLGEGWQYDPIISQMFDECIAAAKDFAKNIQEKDKPHTITFKVPSFNPFSYSKK